MNTSKSIFDQPLNNSISKQRYTFSKAARETYSTKLINGSMYNLPDSLSKRMAGIGYGQKHDFTKHVKQVPAPNKYDIKSFAELNMEEKKGIQFALGREDTWLQGIWATLTQSTPPPDRYQIPSTVTRRQKFTFGQRTQSLQKFNTPGPGNYEYVQAISSKGVYPLSKFQNSGACIIGKDQERFKTLGVNDYPEPGRYSLENIGINQSGIYPKNGMRSAVQQTFSKSTRKGPYEINKVTPGPGRYKMFSEFDQ
ncbi:unnamed protein product [Paramecium primaurelia]|uniref:Uncharacterized protein n=1 Tax=Paramecium primaurelia TaxID=5886 RepID=A0A8S1PAH0_PARPR|nr:unnamed protein product [Paramecium primaurelia]